MQTHPTTHHLKDSSVLLTPRALKRGDTVALIRPSSRLSPEQWKQSIEFLRKQGMAVALYPGSFSKDPYFASSDSERAREFEWAFREPGIKAVFACRGGYGAERMLAEISDAAIEKFSPRIFVGYSDCTFLHQWIQNRLGWLSFHGPLVGFLDQRGIKRLIDEVLDLPAAPIRQDWSEIEILRPGKAKGRLVGGNLSLFRSFGKAALPQEPVILCIEEVNEHFYRVDRMLWSLIDAGYSSYIKGIIVGNLLQCGVADSKTFGLKRLEQTLKKVTDGPIWKSARFGHGVKFQRLIPLGAEAEIKGRSLNILSPQVTR